jgi:hypothetical protein
MESPEEIEIALSALASTLLLKMQNLHPLRTLDADSAFARASQIDCAVYH